jgi:hypothetical protein
METKEEQVKQGVMHLRPGDGRSLRVLRDLAVRRFERTCTPLCPTPCLCFRYA